MKVAFLSPFGMDDAATRRLSYFSENLNKMGYETKVFPKFSYHQIFKERYDILHALKLNPKSGAIGVVLKKLFKKTVLDVDDWDSQVLAERGRTYSAKVIDILERYVPPFYDQVIVCNTQIIQCLLKSGIREEDVETLPNGVDTSFFNPSIDDGEVRKKYNLEDKYVLVYVGSLSYFQQLEPLIRGIATIDKSYSDIILLIVGDGRYRIDLMELAKRLGVSDRIIFTGQVAHKETREYMAAADLCLAYSPNTLGAASAAPGMKVFEYMAMQKPFITTAVGDTPSILENEKAGYMVPPGDSKAIARKIEYLYDNPEDAKKRAIYARKLAVEKYDWKVLSERLGEIYSTL